LQCRKGKAFCEGPFSLYGQQLENYKQTVDVAFPLEKFLRTPMGGNYYQMKVETLSDNMYKSASDYLA